MGWGLGIVYSYRLTFGQITITLVIYVLPCGTIHAKSFNICIPKHAQRSGVLKFLNDYVLQYLKTELTPW